MEDFETLAMSLYEWIVASGQSLLEGVGAVGGSVSETLSHTPQPSMEVALVCGSFFAGVLVICGTMVILRLIANTRIMFAGQVGPVSV